MRKGKMIAFAILGTPPNLQKQKKSPMDSYIDKKLLAEETVRVR
jgi:hypothetical protein